MRYGSHAAVRARDRRRHPQIARVSRERVTACRHALVCTVRKTCAIAGPSAANAEIVARVSAMEGDSWRSAFRRRVTPLPCSADPMSSGVRYVHRTHFARKVVKNLIARGFDIADEKLLHQSVVVIGELFEHRDSAPLFRVAGRRRRTSTIGRGRVFAVNERRAPARDR